MYKQTTGQKRESITVEAGRRACFGAVYMAVEKAQPLVIATSFLLPGLQLTDAYCMRPYGEMDPDNFLNAP